jgi:heme-degrading monooxygenase HmoA
MSDNLVVSIVRFQSRLSDEDVQALYKQRAERYRQLPGLVEKIYLQFRETGEAGAIYVWESEEALRRFRESELAGSISDVYQVEGPPSVELADVCLVVHQARPRVTQ